MVEQKSIDREVGELVVKVDTLIDAQKALSTEVLGAVNVLKQHFDEYVSAHNQKHTGDYEAIEQRATSLERRLKVLEDERILKKGAETSKLAKLIQQFSSSIASIAAVGFVAFFMYLLYNFVQHNPLTT